MFANTEPELARLVNLWSFLGFYSLFASKKFVECLGSIYFLELRSVHVWCLLNKKVNFLLYLYEGSLGFRFNENSNCYWSVFNKISRVWNGTFNVKNNNFVKWCAFWILKRHTTGLSIEEQRSFNLCWISKLPSNSSSLGRFNDRLTSNFD